MKIETKPCSIEAKVEAFSNETYMQIKSKHYPKVNINSGLHQFYGYLLALESLNLVDENDIIEYMKKFTTKIELGKLNKEISE